MLSGDAPEIVSFDVPPPYLGVRRIDAYRERWLPTFEWRASGAVFEIKSLGIAVGADVAFACGLMRCGPPAGSSRETLQRLRLAIGLRCTDGGYGMVLHEHHSFTDTAKAT